MKNICLLLAMGVLAVGLVGCRKTDEEAAAAAAAPTGGLQAGETKSGAGGNAGMSAPGEAVAAPPGVQTGTPGG